jgi:hypothetical protein
VTGAGKGFCGTLRNVERGTYKVALTAVDGGKTTFF